MTDDVDALVAENKRLRRDLRELQARVRALETSRWHRLHPGRLTRRRQSPRTPVASGRPSARGAGATAGLEPIVVRFRDEMLPRGSFSRDWLTEHVSAWEPILRGLEGSASRILEVGSYEGLSACYLLWRLRDATITCIDTFANSAELESIFDANVALVDASRVHKLVGDSRRLLLDLVAGGRQFDLVYVDGSHLGLDVMVDASLSWQLLKPGGTLVFDDYAYRELGDDALLRPGPAIDAFLTVIEGKHELLVRGHQVAVRKSEDLRSSD